MPTAKFVTKEDIPTYVMSDNGRIISVDDGSGCLEYFDLNDFRIYGNCHYGDIGNDQTLILKIIDDEIVECIVKKSHDLAI